jgi:peroxisomal 2,4-dienoyl-CoA reductase
MSRAAFKELCKTKGSIINVSATLHYTTTPWQIHASAAKSGVDTITRSLAAEWGEFGIRVNGIAPGAIKGTEGLSRLGLGPPPEELERLISEKVPLGRAGTTNDIANTALFLCSDAASCI